MQRDDIRLIAANSDWSGKEVAGALRQNVYPTPGAWVRFLKLLCLWLGAGMLVAGVIFFFAYNWQDMHRFFKLGLIAAALITVVLLAVFLRVSRSLRMTLLSAGAALAGALFAVFGQAYQTGANAFDFFLAWTLCITIWVFIARFPPLWLFYLGLCNMTYILYSQQIATREAGDFTLLLLFLFNGVVACLFHIRSTFVSTRPAPRWFLYSLVLVAASFAMSAFTEALFDSWGDIRLSLAVILLLSGAYAAYRYGMMVRQLFYIAVVLFGSLVTGAALVLRVLDEGSGFFLATLFVLTGLYLTVNYLVRLQKKWKNDLSS